MTSINDLIDIFSVLFITNDSEAAHLTSLTEIPSIVLFGYGTPALYSPLGENSESLYLGLEFQPCITVYIVYNEKLSCCHNNICLKNIESKFVFELAMKILRRA